MMCSIWIFWILGIVHLIFVIYLKILKLDAFPVGPAVAGESETGESGFGKWKMQGKKERAIARPLRSRVARFARYAVFSPSSFATGAEGDLRAFCTRFCATGATGATRENVAVFASLRSPATAIV